MAQITNYQICKILTEVFVCTDCALAPLSEVVPMAFFEAGPEVLRLTAHCVSNEKCFWIQPYRAQQSLPQRKKAAEDYASDDDDDDDVHSEGGFDGTHHKLSV